jgi:hypothetical protein
MTNGSGRIFSGFILLKFILGLAAILVALAYGLFPSELSHEPFRNAVPQHDERERLLR